MNTNRDYLNYVTRHMEMLNQILNQMENMNNNMYNNYGRRYSSSTPPASTPPVSTTRRQARSYSSAHPQPVTSSIPSAIGTNSTTNNTNTASTTLSPLINNMINSLFWDPVAIGASEQQINAGTTAIEFANLPEGTATCPITMEPFTEESDICQITACGHCFSRRSLSRWFQNHVTCPVCRYDIREIGNNANQFGAIGNDIVDPLSTPRRFQTSATPTPIQPSLDQPLTYQFDITMNTQDLLNNMQPTAGSMSGAATELTDTTRRNASNRTSGYTASYYNLPYPPNNDGTQL